MAKLIESPKLTGVTVHGVFTDYAGAQAEAQWWYARGYEVYVAAGTTKSHKQNGSWFVLVGQTRDSVTYRDGGV